MNSPHSPLHPPSHHGCWLPEALGMLCCRERSSEAQGDDLSNRMFPALWAVPVQGGSSGETHPVRQWDVWGGEMRPSQLPSSQNISPPWLAMAKALEEHTYLSEIESQSRRHT